LDEVPLWVPLNYKPLILSSSTPRASYCYFSPHTILLSIV